MQFYSTPVVGIIGLGYVGLPLAVELSMHMPVVGFDISTQRIQELNRYYDRTHEVTTKRLEQCHVVFSDQPDILKKASIYIVTVPTPITAHLKPDLRLLQAACQTLGPVLQPGHIVVFESTVYPGVTEDHCGPWLEQYSGLVCGKDFFLGYSPERINPGDPEHTLASMTKVVSGQTPEVTQILKDMYGKVNGEKIFVAKSIRVAEAAKVLENTQRDINIACMNEMAMICRAVGISVYDVLEAAETKWNFLPFRPGLVGGHCIGVDPYYLAACAQEHGVEAHVILAGRTINEAMTPLVLEAIQKTIPAQGRLAIFGLTFKEGIPDLRNSKAIELVQMLQKTYALDVFDACAQKDEVEAVMHCPLHALSEARKGYDAIVLLVPHKAYVTLNQDTVRSLLNPGGKVFDIKGVWRTWDWNSDEYWSL